MARCEQRTVDKNGLIRVDNAMYRVPDEFALRSVQLVVSGDTITVSCGEWSTILDKARDMITAKDGTWSNPVPKEEIFNEKIKELEKDELWNQMQAPRCQRNPGAYDVAFRAGV